MLLYVLALTHHHMGLKFVETIFYANFLNRLENLLVILHLRNKKVYWEFKSAFIDLIVS